MTEIHLGIFFAFIINVMVSIKVNKVLIVDDERLVRWFLERAFVKEGYETDTASNGEEALEKIETGCYSLLITDLKMPIMGGLELLKRLKEKGKLPFTIVTSAYLSDEAVEKAHEAGVYKCIRKPFKIEEILEAVRKPDAY
jgi:CheY-like chemotaxis protein